jgi:hypothetical protein
MKTINTDSSKSRKRKLKAGGPAGNGYHATVKPKVPKRITKEFAVGTQTSLAGNRHHSVVTALAAIYQTRQPDIFAAHARVIDLEVNRPPRGGRTARS